MLAAIKDIVGYTKSNNKNDSKTLPSLQRLLKVEQYMIKQSLPKSQGDHLFSLFRTRPTSGVCFLRTKVSPR